MYFQSHTSYITRNAYDMLQVVAGSVVPPGDGGLRQGGHTDTVGAQPAVLRAGEEVQPGWNRVPVAGHRVHNKHADHRA